MVAQPSTKQAICDPKAFRYKGHSGKKDLQGSWGRSSELAASTHIESDGLRFRYADLIDALGVDHG